jgi:hypothetical protein
MNNDFDFPEQEAKPVPKKTKGTKAEKEVAAEPEVNLLEGGSPEFDEADLEQIFDALMFDGSYTEEVKIGKRLSITLKTRTGKEAREVMTLLDKAGYSLGLTVESIRGLYNLVQSAMIVNGKDISGERFDKKLELIEEMPTPVISAMMIALVKFDRKVEASVRHGEENF